MNKFPRTLLGRRLSDQKSRPLFGLRGGLAIPFKETDIDWKNYQKVLLEFYKTTQLNGFGGLVTRSGYSDVSKVSLDGKVLAEVGPGSLPHRAFWNGSPELYISIDIREEFHKDAAEKCGCRHRPILVEASSSAIPLASASVDVIFSFYSLEHLQNLESSVKEYARILKPGGLFVGAVPNEGGAAWGLGRMFSTRRIMTNRYSIDYDKIIAWEHPNFVDDIRGSLNANLVELDWRQLPFPFIEDPNLNFLSLFTFKKPPLGGIDVRPNY